MTRRDMLEMVQAALAPESEWDDEADAIHQCVMAAIEEAEGMNMSSAHKAENVIERLGALIAEIVDGPVCCHCGHSMAADAHRLGTQDICGFCVRELKLTPAEASV